MTIKCDNGGTRIEGTTIETIIARYSGIWYNTRPGGENNG